MVGSRQGWLEVPYVECPATLADVAAGMRQIDSPGLPDRSVWIVPGLLCRGTAKNGADVLRGEETQLFGLLEGSPTRRQLVCMPGTHSKWVVAEKGRVESLFTAMTGELFELLRKHSLLGRLMPERQDTFDQSACNQGIERARESGGLLHHLFSVRTSGLLGTLEPRQLAPYLSGLLIAHEILGSPWAAELRGQRVHLVGSSAVLEPYSWVMRNRGMTVELHDETLSATGAHLLAKHADLLR
jgi:2-dehydro-3-deoxygalactonokinase